MQKLRRFFQLHLDAAEFVTFRPALFAGSLHAAIRRPEQEEDVDSEVGVQYDQKRNISSRSEFLRASDCVHLFVAYLEHVEHVNEGDSGELVENVKPVYERLLVWLVCRQVCHLQSTESDQAGYLNVEVSISDNDKQDKNTYARFIQEVH